MTATQALRHESEWFYSLLSESITGLSEELAWAQVAPADGEYLHTNGTIIGIVQHIAVCKFIYGSTAFRDTEIRWRHCIDRLETIGTSWPDTLAYLAEAQKYWLSTWESLTDADLANEYLHFRGDKRPAWRLIATVSHHDAYHGGQITLLSSTLTPTSTPPDLQLEEERQAVINLPGW